MRTLCSLILILACGSIGCGKRSGPEKIVVFGKVTYQGEPIEDGEIAFQPEKGADAPPSSAPIKKGEYRLEGKWGLQPGTYKIAIRSYKVTQGETMLPGGKLDRPPAVGGIQTKEQLLPEKFNTKSTLPPLTIATGQSSVESSHDLKD